jgi:hypothetical protein
MYLSAYISGFTCTLKGVKQGRPPRVMLDSEFKIFSMSSHLVAHPAVLHAHPGLLVWPTYKVAFVHTPSITQSSMTICVVMLPRII